MNPEIEVRTRVIITAVDSLLAGKHGTVVAVRTGGRYPLSVRMDEQREVDTPVAFARDELKVIR